jgi:hypothetical protein
MQRGRHPRYEANAAPKGLSPGSLNASLDDVAAAVEGKPTLDASEETQLALAGYRDAMTYVLQVADDKNAAIDEGMIKALHFMMLNTTFPRAPVAGAQAISRLGTTRQAGSFMKDPTLTEYRT